MRSTVIAYHAIADPPGSGDPHHLFVTPPAFEDQMAFLARRRTVVSLSELLHAGARMRPVVAITFDDAYENVAANALPVLERYGFPATVFVPTRWIGAHNAWDDVSPDGLEIMARDRLEAVARAGLVTLESHGHAHIDYTRTGAEEIGRDLSTSVEILAEVAQRRPSFFAFPYGRTSPLTSRVVEDAGFAAAFTIDLPDRGTFAFGRVPIGPLDGPRTFAMKTSGAWLRIRRSRLGAAARSALEPVIRRTSR